MAIDVFFEPPTMFKKKPRKKKRVIELVKMFVDMPEDAAYAVVVNGSHTSRSDSTVHITVDFYTSEDEDLGRFHILCSLEAGTA
ncbi:hypothetical protein SVAN01_10419 [Stagonosporopsis vannaccii]|nr:hypothetical protein SVAN01_10419 [Stagonosporopsis vannaccii]